MLRFLAAAGNIREMRGGGVPSDRRVHAAVHGDIPVFDQRALRES